MTRYIIKLFFLIFLLFLQSCEIQKKEMPPQGERYKMSFEPSPSGAFLVPINAVYEPGLSRDIMNIEVDSNGFVLIEHPDNETRFLITGGYHYIPPTLTKSKWTAMDRYDAWFGDDNMQLPPVIFHVKEIMCASSGNARYLPDTWLIPAKGYKINYEKLSGKEAKPGDRIGISIWEWYKVEGYPISHH